VKGSFYYIYSAYKHIQGHIVCQLRKLDVLGGHQVTLVNEDCRPERFNSHRL